MRRSEHKFEYIIDGGYIYINECESMLQMPKSLAIVIDNLVQRYTNCRLSPDERIINKYASTRCPHYHKGGGGRVR